MSHKYDSDIAEQLSGETPSDELGSVQDFGWYGLYLNEPISEPGGTGGGTVLHEDSQGFVFAEQYDTDLEVNDRWHELQSLANDFYDTNKENDDD